MMVVRYKVPTKSKYKNVRAVRGSIKFHSQLEAGYYDYLELMKKEGEVTHFLMQVPFHLPGGIKYVLDFVVFFKDGHVEYVDVKGYSTQIYKMKKKQVEELYPIDIKEINKGNWLFVRMGESFVGGCTAENRGSTY